MMAIHCFGCINFYPRPPRGGRLVKSILIHKAVGISIHALREEGDGFEIFQFLEHCHFYPRPPRGGRQMAGADALPRA